MTFVEQFIEAIRNKDSQALSDLFCQYGSINDYCRSSSGRHAYGKEGIEMMYRNLFFFGRMSISNVTDITENSVDFIECLEGRYVRARALLGLSRDGTKLARVNIIPFQ